MLQTLKIAPVKLIAAALKPHSLLASFRYRLHPLLEEPVETLPHDVLETITPRDEDFRNMSFTFSVIALCARVATLDGGLTQEKYITFRESFPLRSSICSKIRSLFVLACQNKTPYTHYVTQIKYTFQGNQELFSSLVDRLFRIAAADGKISREEDRMLAKIAHMLELTPAEFSKIRDRYEGPQRAHEVLGLNPRVKSAALKRRYRELMRLYHPDSFGGQEISPEIELLLRFKTSEINRAYRAMSKKAA